MLPIAALAAGVAAAAGISAFLLAPAAQRSTDQVPDTGRHGPVPRPD